MRMSYDSKCLELAEYFFDTKDPRLKEIAQAIQDAVESFPCAWDGETASQHLDHREPAALRPPNKRHKVTCKLFPDPFDERDPVGPCTCYQADGEVK